MVDPVIQKRKIIQINFFIYPMKHLDLLPVNLSRKSRCIIFSCSDILDRAVVSSADSQASQGVLLINKPEDTRGFISQWFFDRWGRVRGGEEVDSVLPGPGSGWAPAVCPWGSEGQRRWSVPSDPGRQLAAGTWQTDLLAAVIDTVGRRWPLPLTSPHSVGPGRRLWE